MSIILTLIQSIFLYRCINHSSVIIMLDLIWVRVKMITVMVVLFMVISSDLNKNYATLLTNLVRSKNILHSRGLNDSNKTKWIVQTFSNLVINNYKRTLNLKQQPFQDGSVKQLMGFIIKRIT